MTPPMVDVGAGGVLLFRWSPVLRFLMVPLVPLGSPCITDWALVR